jgi:hypothetical protein
MTTGVGYSSAVWPAEQLLWEVGLRGETLDAIDNRGRRLGNISWMLRSPVRVKALPGRIRLAFNLQGVRGGRCESEADLWPGEGS